MLTAKLIQKIDRSTVHALEAVISISTAIRALDIVLANKPEAHEAVDQVRSILNETLIALSDVISQGQIGPAKRRVEYRTDVDPIHGIYWSACESHYEPDCGMASGSGRSEDEAVEDLRDQLAERFECEPADLEMILSEVSRRTETDEGAARR